MATADPRVRIVTDSTCNLPAELLQQYRVPQVAPIIVIFGKETYREGVDIQTQEFYERIRRTGIVPTTSQPPVGDLRRAVPGAGQGAGPDHVDSPYRQAQRHAGLGLHGDADGARGASHSFRLAGDLHGQRAFACSRPRAWPRRAPSRPDIVARLEAIRDRMNLYLTPETLKYLQLSGRIGKLQGALASLLNVKPIIRCRDGLLDAFERVRTRAASLDRLLVLTQEAVGSTDPVNVGVIHADAHAEAARPGPAPSRHGQLPRGIRRDPVPCPRRPRRTRDRGHRILQNLVRPPHGCHGLLI